jgi:hypothetical protein
VTACYKVDSQDLNRLKGTRFLISVVDCAMDGKGGLSADGGGTQGLSGGAMAGASRSMGKRSSNGDGVLTRDGNGSGSGRVEQLSAHRQKCCGSKFVLIPVSTSRISYPYPSPSGFGRVLGTHRVYHNINKNYNK